MVKKALEAVDTVCSLCFKGAGWLSLLLVLVTAEQVMARYFFQSSSIGLQELEWHLFGAIFLLSGAYTLRLKGHVRVDVVYGRLSQSAKSWIDRLGFLFFLAPTCFVLIFYGVEFTSQALDYNVGDSNDFFSSGFFGGERSPDPGGLPARWIIKSLIPFSAFLLLIQGLAMFLESFLTSGD